MKLGDLTEIHVPKRLCHCEVCDGPSEIVTKYYEYKWFSEKLQCEMRGKCLDCCKKYGTVVDWEEREM